MKTDYPTHYSELGQILSPDIATVVMCPVGHHPLAPRQWAHLQAFISLDQIGLPRRIHGLCR